MPVGAESVTIHDGVAEPRWHNSNCYSAQSKSAMDYTHIVEGGVGGLRSDARHPAEQADVKLPIETMKVSANMIDDASRQYEQYTRKLWDMNKCVAEHCGVLRQRNENEAIDEIHVGTTAIFSDEVDVKHWKIVSSGVNQHERYQSSADTQVSKEVPC